MGRERNRPFSFRDLDAGDFRTVRLYEWCELKYDGHFARVILDGTDWQVRSSTDRIVSKGRLETRFKRTELWCEHLRGTEWACDPRRRGLYEWFAVFAAPQVDGRPMPPHADESRTAVCRMLSREQHQPLQIMQVERYRVEKAPKLWEQHTDFEGLIFGGSRGLARMKRRATMDYVCMGFEASDSDRYSGWGVRSVVGGLYVGSVLQRIITVSGLTDEQRREFHAHPKRYVGKVFEADGKALFRSGKLRHPNFVRWRDDKAATACVLPQK